MNDETKERFVKIKMPTYYIAKHSDEDLQAAVLAERRHLAEHYLAIMRDAVAQAVKREREACAKLCEDLDDDIVDGLAGWQFAEAIRARSK